MNNCPSAPKEDANKPRYARYYPSKNYEIAQSSLVYRLSELVFGSLLAAYVLGFISFSANILLEPASSFVLWSLPFILTYFFISGTFAYITATLYVRYHAGILTMPTSSVERSRFDLSIALLQAVFFGFSMLFPRFSYIFVSAVLLLAAWRQRKELSYLIVHYTNELLESESQPSPLSVGPERIQKDELGKNIETTIEGSELYGWSPVSIKHYRGIKLLVVLGLILCLLPEITSAASSNIDIILDMSMSLRWTYAIASLILFVMVLRGSLRTMEEGVGYIHKENFKNIDVAYDELERKLSELPNTGNEIEHKS